MNSKRSNFQQYLLCSHIVDLLLRRSGPLFSCGGTESESGLGAVLVQASRGGSHFPEQRKENDDAVVDGGYAMVDFTHGGWVR